MKKFINKPSLSLRLKAILSIILLEIILLGTFTYLSVNKYHLLLEEQMKENYLWLTQTLSAGLSTNLIRNDTHGIGIQLDEAIKDRNVLYLAVRDSTGALVASRQNRDHQAFVPGSLPGDFQNSDIIREIGDHPPGLLHQQGHSYEITKPIHYSGRTIGWLQLGIFTVRLNKAVAGAAYWGFRILIAFFVAGAFLVALIDRKVKQTLTGLIMTTHNMADGDFSQRVQIHTGDDLEKLGSSFNKMADSLNQRNAQIRKHEQELEGIVADRTKQLQDEKTKLKAILDHVPSGFLLLDKNMRVQMASANFKEITGRNIAELAGKCCTISLWKDQLCSTCATEHCLRTQKLATKIVKVERNQETVNYFEHTAIPIKEKGNIEYILEIITDITHRQLLQEQMIRAEKLAATGEMATVVAHEMRNSLTSVNMILQLLLENTTDNNLDLESIQVALRSIRRTESVVNQLLQFSRPKALQKHKSDLNLLVKESIDITRHQFDRHGIATELLLDPDMPTLEIDAEKMKEALVNLLLNAEQAMDGAGHAKVTTGIKKLPAGVRDFSPHHLKGNLLPNNRNGYGEIFIAKGSQVVSIGIADTGKGITPEQIERIFEPFFTTKINGTGLGLPVVKQVVNEHGGVVRVASRPGSGSTFEILLPLAENV